MDKTVADPPNVVDVSNLSNRVWEKKGIRKQSSNDSQAPMMRMMMMMMLFANNDDDDDAADNAASFDGGLR